MSDSEGSLKEAERILCSDGNCIGTINEKGFCNICRKPRGAVLSKRERERSYFVDSSKFVDREVSQKVSVLEGIGSVLAVIGCIFAVIVFFVIVLALLGGVLFLGVTFARAIWKFVVWAWS